MSYKKYNDYELIYMVREKDEDSYNAIFSKYYPIIKKISFNYYNRFNNYGYDYDDFIQEACLAFHGALSSFNEMENVLFYTYSITCMERKLISFCKKISCLKRTLSPDNYVEYNDNFYSDQKSNVFDEAQINDFYVLLKKTIYDLDYVDSCVLELKINNFSYKEISKLLDIPLRTVQFKAQKIRKILKQNLYNF